jgi:hypothetical protein
VQETRGANPAHDYCIFHGGKDNVRMLRSASCNKLGPFTTISKL